MERVPAHVGVYCPFINPGVECWKDVVSQADKTVQTFWLCARTRAIISEREEGAGRRRTLASLKTNIKRLLIQQSVPVWLRCLIYNFVQVICTV